jgi:uncharacterized protein YjiS (DUF1127 family)
LNSFSKLKNKIHRLLNAYIRHIFLLQQQIHSILFMRKSIMKLFNLAIASIVDANTGTGVNQRFIEQFGSKNSSYEQFGREIRAKSILGLVGKIKSALIQYIADSKAKDQERRSVEEVSQMSASMLKDVGLTQNDADDLHLGLISLDTLNARRDQNRNQREARLSRLSRSSKQVNVSGSDHESANQENYEMKKCA